MFMIMSRARANRNSQPPSRRFNNSIKLFHRNQAYAFIYISIWQKLQATLNIRSTYRKDRAVFDASVCILNVQVLEYTKRQTTLAARQV